MEILLNANKYNNKASLTNKNKDTECLLLFLKNIFLLFAINLEKNLMAMVHK